MYSKEQGSCMVISIPCNEGVGSNTSNIPTLRQECIPVGCVLFAAVAVSPGGVCLIACSDTNIPLGADPPRTSHLLLPCGQTDACKNITFATLLRIVIKRKDFLWTENWVLEGAAIKSVWIYYFKRCEEEVRPKKHDILSAVQPSVSYAPFNLSDNGNF